MKELIVFKLSKEGFSIIIDEYISFDMVKRLLKEKFSKSEDFFHGVQLKTTLKGRELNDEEFEEIKGIIEDNTGFTDILREIKLFDWQENSMEGNTKFYRGTMRSGAAINYKGNVVVIGDINPGAEVVTTGNIIVTGAIKGMVHAGCQGNRNAIVCGMGICPTQLRIANIITVSPKEKAEKNAGFETACIKDGNIYIMKN
jgi:septum site-determining protein MinC